MKKKVVFAIFVLLLLVSCTPGNNSCDIVLTDNHVAIEGAHIVTEEEYDVAFDLLMNAQLTHSEYSSNEIDFPEKIYDLSIVLAINPYYNSAYLERSFIYYV